MRWGSVVVNCCKLSQSHGRIEHQLIVSFGAAEPKAGIQCHKAFITSASTATMAAAPITYAAERAMRNALLWSGLSAARYGPLAALPAEHVGHG